MEMGFRRVNVADIEEDHVNNPRLEFDDAALDDLANSINKQGLLQPILVRAKRDENGLPLPGKYIIISGARRYKAIRYKLGLQEIDVGVTTSLDDEAHRFVAQVQENEQREALNGEELRAAVLQMHLIYGMSNAVIASNLGKKSSNFVSRILASARPEMEKFSQMCGRSTEVLSEIKKFDLADRERLLAHFEKSNIPFTGGQLRKIGLVRDAGVDIHDMDIATVIGMTANEVRRIADDKVSTSQPSTLRQEIISTTLTASTMPNGKYVNDSDEDDAQFSGDIQALQDALGSDIEEVFEPAFLLPSSFNGMGVQSSWAGLNTIPIGKYANDDADDNSIGTIPSAVDLLDQTLHLKINLKISRLKEIFDVLSNDLPEDQIIELPLSIKIGRARDLIASIGGDPRLDTDRLVQDLTKRLARR